MKGKIIVEPLLDIYRASFLVDGYSERISLQRHGESASEAVGNLVSRILEDYTEVTITEIREGM